MSNMRNLPARMVREVRKAMMHDDVMARKVFTTTLGEKRLRREWPWAAIVRGGRAGAYRYWEPLGA